MSTIAGILLAAGGSSRMGRPKQLMPCRGAPLVVHAARTMLASACRPIVVVTGASADETRAALAGLDVNFAHNPRWQDGIGTSIVTAIAHLSPRPVRRERDRVRVPPERQSTSEFTEPSPQPSPGVPGEGVDGALITLCDQPLVTPAVLNTLVQTLETRDDLLAVACSYSGTLGVPAVFRRQLFDELVRLDPAHGAKIVLQRHADRVGSVPFEPAATDIDTPEQYAQLKMQGPHPADPIQRGPPDADPTQ